MTQLQKIARDVRKDARETNVPNREDGVAISKDAIEDIARKIRDNDKAISFLAKM